MTPGTGWCKTRISQAFPLNICILQAIEDWRWNGLGTWLRCMCRGTYDSSCCGMFRQWLYRPNASINFYRSGWWRLLWNSDEQPLVACGGWMREAWSSGIHDINKVLRKLISYFFQTHNSVIQSLMVAGSTQLESRFLGDNNFDNTSPVLFGHTPCVNWAPPTLPSACTKECLPNWHNLQTL